MVEGDLIRQVRFVKDSYFKGIILGFGYPFSFCNINPVVALNSVLGFNKPLSIEAQPLNQGNHWIAQIVTLEKYHQSSGNRLFMVICI